jgi:hypothetical protein
MDQFHRFSCCILVLALAACDNNPPPVDAGRDAPMNDAPTEPPDAPMDDAPMADAGPPASFSGTVSLTEVTIQGVPQLGQGLQVSI